MAFRAYINDASYLASANVYLLDIQMLEGEFEFGMTAVVETAHGEVPIRIQSAALGLSLEWIQQRRHSIVIDKPDVPLEWLTASYVGG